ncbi:uncharacterized protein BT62DRAFT_622558 [Guyanagaster necrorhizus]|uniref:Uncharacterized protein n=1 Tax=Guyanagaster necrorhizus TaxID=856835 RepID=A0A9P7W113_9AGAR|nr:uncharacterized protein BT62DRAFT_622558 [Guyanagaster necrorhizus MCA 3950]KAG7450075.1 hypothetical protein BT62DRAFT_622558 [Guyanagaster necrorhizus MCA 3950]
MSQNIVLASATARTFALLTRNATLAKSIPSGRLRKSSSVPSSRTSSTFRLWRMTLRMTGSTTGWNFYDQAT